MERSILEANMPSASQEISLTLLKNVRDRVQKYPFTCHYPVSDKCSPRPCFISYRYILILSSQLRLGLPDSLFPSHLPHQKHVCIPFYVPYIVPKNLLPNGRNTPCRLSATAYLVYSQVLFISADSFLLCNVRTCCDVGRNPHITE
jgi:hypothetical protein